MAQFNSKRSASTPDAAGEGPASDDDVLRRDVTYGLSGRSRSCPDNTYHVENAPNTKEIKTPKRRKYSIFNMFRSKRWNSDDMDGEKAEKGEVEKAVSDSAGATSGGLSEHNKSKQRNSIFSLFSTKKKLPKDRSRSTWHDTYTDNSTTDSACSNKSLDEDYLDEQRSKTLTPPIKPMRLRNRKAVSLDDNVDPNVAATTGEFPHINEGHFPKDTPGLTKEGHVLKSHLDHVEIFITPSSSGNSSASSSTLTLTEVKTCSEKERKPRKSQKKELRESEKSEHNYEKSENEQSLSGKEQEIENEYLKKPPRPIRRYEKNTSSLSHSHGSGGRQNMSVRSRPNLPPLLLTTRPGLSSSDPNLESIPPNLTTLIDQPRQSATADVSKVMLAAGGASGGDGARSDFKDTSQKGKKQSPLEETKTYAAYDHTRLRRFRQRNHSAEDILARPEQPTSTSTQLGSRSTESSPIKTNFPSEDTSPDTIMSVGRPRAHSDVTSMDDVDSEDSEHYVWALPYGENLRPPEKTMKRMRSASMVPPKSPVPTSPRPKKKMLMRFFNKRPGISGRQDNPDQSPIDSSPSNPFLLLPSAPLVQETDKTATNKFKKAYHHSLKIRPTQKTSGITSPILRRKRTNTAIVDIAIDQELSDKAADRTTSHREKFPDENLQGTPDLEGTVTRRNRSESLPDTFQPDISLLQQLRDQQDEEMEDSEEELEDEDMDLENALHFLNNPRRLTCIAEDDQKGFRGHRRPSRDAPLIKNYRETRVTFAKPKTRPRGNSQDASSTMGAVSQLSSYF